ncbi:SDR family NAD(P)-dependent oxidoreductase [Massilia sp. CFBP9012]|uniref:SDR family oxidoreductase n=1 Tax=Massilia sp. CFBP9012 TaxID=3096531 RepID=UPI002A6B49B5|nr:SDR family NAD(P)-dependent oxidoreductase [Massilia sp. CFBP9012]MDY0973804.1 SDR family NAD(P)-dependent oxidoreductase [Massilia sp. CFBP9012]
MKMTCNTILITGGASGIGRGLAEAFHRLGNQVIVAGRRKDYLDAVTQANPGMRAIELDVTDQESIAEASARVLRDFPSLDVLINNAGVMAIDNPAEPIDDRMLVDSVATNFLGPIRLTSALVEHLKTRPASTIVNVTSGMGFVPFAIGAVYSASKAALHSWTMTLRYQLEGSTVKVVELAPPWVRTDLLNSNEAEGAMPRAEFIAESMALLATGADEVLVDRVRRIRANPGPNEAAYFQEFNDMMLKG